MLTAMRIAIPAIDTRGGVEPYTALALGLERAGHTVRMVVPAEFVAGVSARGIDAVGLTGGVQDALRAGVSEMSAPARARLMLRESARHVRIWAGEALAACEGVDLVLAGVGGGGVARAVAERLGVPFVAAYLQPVDAPTRAFPGVLLPRAPAPLHRISHRISDAALQVMLRAGLRRARTEVLGLPGRAAPAQTGTPVLYGFSPLVVPPPPDWEPHRHVTGYWSLPPSGAPAPELEAFLAAGPAPVCVGFGSMVGGDPRATADLVRAAVRRAGVRAVLLSGWGALDAEPSDDVFVADEVPHDLLFPRAAAVVHHGGAGTTGAALRAGVPAVVVPFAADQPFWGSRVAALGVGPRPIPRRALTVDTLAQALRATAPLRERAAGLGARIRAEDGVGQAVAVLGRVG
jgi:sterol 3beta-glucosyltransferase